MTELNENKVMARRDREPPFLAKALHRARKDIVNDQRDDDVHIRASKRGSSKATRSGSGKSYGPGNDKGPRKDQ